MRLLTNHILSLLFALVALSAALPAQSASVLEVDLHEMADAAGLVFEGRVVAKETRATLRGRLRTCFTFLVVDVIEGQHSGGPLELCFAGGKLGELEMRIGGMVYPKLGERGIYFAEPQTRRWAHPLCGWEQGHFILQTTGPGREPKVFTARGKAVADLMEPEAERRRRTTRGFAHGVIIGPHALSAASFKARFRALRRAR